MSPKHIDKTTLASRIDLLEQELAVLKNIQQQPDCELSNDDQQILQHSLANVSEQDFAYQVLEASTDGYLDWDIKGASVTYSKECLELLGYGQNEPNTPAHIFSHVHELDKPGLLQKFKHCLQTGQGYSVEFRLLTKEQKLMWIRLKIKVFEQDASGKASRIVGGIYDITPFKENQNALVAAKSFAREANATKSEFLARMSHEIRTPMNAIIGMGHLLKDTALNRLQYDYLNNIDQAANSLLTIINEILDFSKIESGQFILENVHIDLENLVAKLTRQLTPRAERKGLELIYEVDADVPQFFRGDGARLSQIIGNLIGNAIKFTDSGDIQLLIKKTQDLAEFVELEFEVKDSGIGMSSAKIQALFDPFTQADGSSSRKIGGTGLGLTLCKHLVEMMQGTIQVSSEPNAGSSFKFTARFEHSQIGTVVLREKPRRFDNLRALVVDDNLAARTIISKTANSIHLRTDTAGDAKTAIEMLEKAEMSNEQHYDIVLMDYNMPNLNGLDASRLIKQDRKIVHRPSVILVSAHQKDEIFGLDLPETIDGFIHKPVSQSRLFDAIAEAFGESVFATATTDSLRAEDLALLSSARILLAEDNIVNQKVAVGILKKKGVEVVVANNGRQAIDILAMHPNGYFDLILMDMEMPEIDGYQATQLIREGDNSAAIPIVAMTAHAMQEDRKRCIECGMDGYITKPVEPDLLHKTLARFLRKAQTQKASLP